MANVFRLLQLTDPSIPSKSCSKLDLDPGFRRSRQVDFGSMWRDQAKIVCFMARSSVNIGGHPRFGTHKWYSVSEKTSGNGEIEEPKPKDSHSKNENIKNVKNKVLENQLKEIQRQLREITRKVGELKETVIGSSAQKGSCSTKVKKRGRNEIDETEPDEGSKPDEPETKKPRIDRSECNKFKYPKF